VAVCDQVEDAALAKGLVKREVTRVVTPGTITEDELLDPRTPNYIVALGLADDEYGLAWADLSTGEFFASDVQPERLDDELNRIGAAELLLTEKTADRLGIGDKSHGSFHVSHRADWTFDPPAAREALRKHFGIATLAGFGFDDEQPCLVAAGALLLYLEETLKTGLAHLRRLRPHRAENHLALDDVTRRSLELTRTLRDGDRQGSLLSALDRTVTSMGARILHDAVLAPLAEKPAIEARLDAVEELIKEHALRSDLRELLGALPDLQRHASRVSTGRATPRDLAAIARALRLLPKFKARITGRRSTLLAELEGRLELCPDLREQIDSALADNPPVNPRDGGVVRPGFHAELDELRKLASEGKN
jgi:DNA mismatch repair protein MutS